MPCVRDATRDGSVWKVEPGDSLHSIARRNNTTVEALARVNSLPNADFIQAGQLLRVPDASDQHHPALHLGPGSLSGEFPKRDVQGTFGSAINVNVRERSCPENDGQSARRTRLRLPRQGRDSAVEVDTRKQRHLRALGKYLTTFGRQGSVPRGEEEAVNDQDSVRVRVAGRLAGQKHARTNGVLKASRLGDRAHGSATRLPEAATPEAHSHPQRDGKWGQILRLSSDVGMDASGWHNRIAYGGLEELHDALNSDDITVVNEDASGVVRQGGLVPMAAVCEQFFPPGRDIRRTSEHDAVISSRYQDPAQHVISGEGEHGSWALPWSTSMQSHEVPASAVSESAVPWNNSASTSPRQQANVNNTTALAYNGRMSFPFFSNPCAKKMTTQPEPCRTRFSDPAPYERCQVPERTHRSAACASPVSSEADVHEYKRIDNWRTSSASSASSRSSASSIQRYAWTGIHNNQYDRRFRRRPQVTHESSDSDLRSGKRIRIHQHTVSRALRALSASSSGYSSTDDLHSSSAGSLLNMEIGDSSSASDRKGAARTKREMYRLGKVRKRVEKELADVSRRLLAATGSSRDGLQATQALLKAELEHLSGKERILAGVVQERRRLMARRTRCLAELLDTEVALRGRGSWLSQPPGNGSVGSRSRVHGEHGRSENEECLRLERLRSLLSRELDHLERTDSMMRCMVNERQHLETSRCKLSEELATVTTQMFSKSERQSMASPLDARRATIEQQMQQVSRSKDFLEKLVHEMQELQRFHYEVMQKMKSCVDDPRPPNYSRGAGPGNVYSLEHSGSETFSSGLLHHLQQALAHQKAVDETFGALDIARDTSEVSTSETSDRELSMSTAALVTRSRELETRSQGRTQGHSTPAPQGRETVYEATMDPDTILPEREILSAPLPEDFSYDMLARYSMDNVRGMVDDSLGDLWDEDDELPPPGQENTASRGDAEGMKLARSSDNPHHGIKDLSTGVDKEKVSLQRHTCLRVSIRAATRTTESTDVRPPAAGAFRALCGKV
eukprot:scaffold176_cov356-Prasinococcus_capsulatus_cf.AAC.11